MLAVIEHIVNPELIIREIYRVLKPGGFAIIQVPLFYPLLDVTYDDKSITSPTKREKAYGQTDHVRMYGKDYADRLRSVGFIVDENRYFEKLPTEDVKRFALPLDEPVFYCRKG